VVEGGGGAYNMHICVCFRGGVRPARVAACIHAYQCPLCGHTARLPAVFAFLLQQSDAMVFFSWKGNAGVIDTGARWGSWETQTRHTETGIFNLSGGRGVIWMFWEVDCCGR